MNSNHVLCPVCMQDLCHAGYPAISRYEDVSICSDCARDEAIEEFFSQK